MRITGIFAVVLFLPLLTSPAQSTTVTAQAACADVRVDQAPALKLLQLDDVIREALEKNPEAQSLLHVVNALQRRVPQVKSLPAPNC